MSDPTLADLQAVPIAAWRGAMGAGGGEDAFEAALAAGLIWEEPPTDDSGEWGWGLTPKGTRYLAALAELSEGLIERQRSMLEHALGNGHRNHYVCDIGTNAPHVGWVAMVKLGIAERGRNINDDSCSVFRATDLGSAVVLYLERAR